MGRLAALLVTVSIAAMIGGCGRSWPKVRPVAAPGFTSGNGQVRTVDILPADIQVWTHARSTVTADQIAAGLDSMVHTMVHSELSELGYDVVAQLDWDGNYAAGPGGTRQAMHPDALAATVLSLSTFGIAQARTGPRLLVPHLPARLGRATGSDATLYIGGWAYAGVDKKGMSTGAKVALGVLAVALVVGVVVLAVAGGKGGGGGGGAGKVVGGAGKVVGGVAKGVAKAGKGLARATGGFGRVAGRLLRTTARGVVRGGIIVGRHGPRIALETLDAFGRAGFHTHVHVQPQRIDYYEQKRTPHTGPSKMMLEMTLVDNYSGRVLWHARRRFPASVSKPGHVARAVEQMLTKLPAVYGGKTVLAQGTHPDAVLEPTFRAESGGDAALAVAAR